MLLIGAGLTGLIETVRRRSGFGGSIWAVTMIVFGAAYQLRNLGIVETSFWGMLWPLALVGVGLSMLFGKPAWSSWNDSKVVTSISYEHNDDAEQRERYETERKIRGLVGDIKLGGPTYRLESSAIELKAGNIVLDLRDTVIPEGETVLDLHCKAGDIDVYLPEGLDFWVQASVKMGHVQLNGQRANNAALHYESEGFATSERRVKLIVSVKFGDVDVKQVR